MPTSDPHAGDAQRAATFHEHRSVIFGLAYRMLGSVADAEDIVQETYLRWRQQDLAEVASARAWLITAATRLGIDRLRSAQVKREEYVGVWLPEPLVGTTENSPRDTAALADSLSLAFMLLLESLPAVDRAVFLLHEAFGYDYREISGIVGRSEAACRQIVSRAKRALAQRPPADARPPEQADQLVQQFLQASRHGSLGELLALLTDDVVLYTDGGGKARAAIRPIVTADRVARFLVGVRRFGPGDARFGLADVNGGPGAVVRHGETVDRVISFAFSGNRIRAIYIVRNPDKLTHVPGAFGD